MSSFRISAKQIDQFEEDGFFVVPNLLDAEEVALLIQVARADYELAEKKATRADGEGGAIDLEIGRAHV